ncbi:MAG: hypothetical protein RL060_627, partial [Bacteroidota bacterium]
MKKIVNIILLSILYLGITQLAYAQASVSPLRYSKSNITDAEKSASRKRGMLQQTVPLRTHNFGDTVNLPFADNFDNASSLDLNLWEFNPNISISDTAGYCFFKSNVITLDCFNSSGKKYANDTIYGTTDSLISKPINLLASTDTYLSFYWQAGGNLDAPDSIKFDSLIVSFLSPTTKVWVKASVLKSAYKMKDNFKFTSIKIVDSLLFNGFKFKLQAVGLLNGVQDAWNIDYLKLTKNSSSTDSSIGNIALPFVDDFTTKQTNINTNLWFSSGVTINNTNAINAPTPNVATFDGIDSTGAPYNFNNSFAYGACDQLVSKPINLGNLTAKDNVYLSFFWQAGGLVELPDSAQTDSISVFLKTKISQTWVKIWTYVPHDNILDPTAFHLVFINIPDSLMYNGSQFKFQSFGNQSGAWDNWHIDYVRLDKNRNTDDTKYT